MKELLAWAEENCYLATTTAKEARIEGKSRPEVNGMTIFEVNDDHHLKCSV